MRNKWPVLHVIKFDAEIGFASCSHNSRQASTGECQTAKNILSNGVVSLFKVGGDLCVCVSPEGSARRPGKKVVA